MAQPLISTVATPATSTLKQDIFLKIDGINGESLDQTHRDEIEVLRWSWKIEQPSSMHRGSGGGASKATFHDLEFEHYIDRSSPNLMQYVSTGRHIPKAVLVMRKAGGKALEYHKIIMSDVLITSWEPSAHSAEDELTREKVRLSFAKVEHQYTVQNVQGGSGGVVTASFDIKANQET